MYLSNRDSLHRSSVDRIETILTFSLVNEAIISNPVFRICASRLLQRGLVPLIGISSLYMLARSTKAKFNKLQSLVGVFPARKRARNNKIIVCQR